MNFFAPFLKHKRIAIAILILVILLFFEDILFIANARRIDKPIIGLKVFGTRVSNLSAPELKKFLKNPTGGSLPTLTLFEGDQTTEVTSFDIGTAIASNDSVRSILKEGRDGTIFRNVWLQNKALLGLDSKRPIIQFSPELFQKTVARIALQINQDPVPPMPDFTHDLSKTIPGKAGISVNALELEKLIKEHILDSHPRPLAIPTTPTLSTHSNDELDSIRKAVPDLVAEPIQILSAGQIFTLTREDLLSLLTVVERLDPKNPQKKLLVLRIDDQKLNRRLGEFARKVEEITKAEFDDHDARVAIYAQFYSGTRSRHEIPTGNENDLRKSTADTSSTRGDETQSAGVYSALAQNQPSPGEQFVYLTFDDGPNDIYHPLVLDILKKYNVKATFFLVGENSKKYDAITRRTITEGHVIGNHSLTHAFLPKLSPASVRNEIQATEEILKPFQGNDITLFRPPYGGVDANVKKSAKDLKVKLVLWSVDPRDWSEPATDELVERVVSHVQNQSDILLHSNHLSTIKALPLIIKKLKDKGYAFKTLE